MRPTYSYAMKSVIIGFTGFKEKDDLVITQFWVLIFQRALLGFWIIFYDNAESSCQDLSLLGR